MTLKTTWTAVASLALVLGCSSDSTGPAVSTLQNDDFTVGGTAAFQSGFVTGEAAAVRLGPQSAAYTVRKVLFLFGGATTTKTVTLTIYQDGDSTNPGSILHTADYSLTGSSSAFQEIDLLSQNIHVGANQKIRVALRFQHDALPSVAIDAARTASRNLIYISTIGWITAEAASLSGDFIIRAEISTP